jgi:hypothetical protein
VGDFLVSLDREVAAILEGAAAFCLSHIQSLSVGVGDSGKPTNKRLVDDRIQPLLRFGDSARGAADPVATAPAFSSQALMRAIIGEVR